MRVFVTWITQRTTIAGLMLIAGAIVGYANGMISLQSAEAIIASGLTGIVIQERTPTSTTTVVVPPTVAPGTAVVVPPAVPGGSGVAVVTTPPSLTPDLHEDDPPAAVPMPAPTPEELREKQRQEILSGLQDVMQQLLADAKARAASPTDPLAPPADSTSPPAH